MGQNRLPQLLFSLFHVVLCSLVGVSGPLLPLGATFSVTCQGHRCTCVTVEADLRFLLTGQLAVAVVRSERWRGSRSIVEKVLI